MGSWNGTCGLTNLPIGEGADVVAYIIAMHGHGNSGDSASAYLYPNQYAHPIGPALLATYDGYGGIENLAGPALAWWRARLVELSPALMTMDACTPNDEVLKSLEGLITGMREDELYWGAADMRDKENVDYEPDSRLGLMLLRKGAYDCFMQASMASDEWILDEHSTPVDMYLARLAEVEPLLQAALTGNTRTRSVLFAALESLKAFSGATREVLTSVFDYLKRHEDPGLLEEIARAKVFDMSLEAARKSWNRQCGAGNASSDTTLQLALARYVVDTVSED